MEFYFIMTVLVVVGAVLAFDIGGVASNIRQNNRVSMPGSERLKERLPNPARIVRWIFLVPGILMVTLVVAAAVKQAFFR